VRADRTFDISRFLDLISDSYKTNADTRDRSVAYALKRLKSDNRTLEDLVNRRTGELKSARFLFGAVLQNTAQGIIIFDDEDRIVACNQRAADLLELPEHLSREGTPIAAVIKHQWSIGEFDGNDKEATGWVGKGDVRAAPSVYERQRPNGTIIEIRTLLLDGGGALRTFSDITERRRQENAAREAQELHRSLFENAAVAIYRATLDGQMTAANPEFARIHGYGSVEELLAAQNDRREWRYVKAGRREKFRRRLFRLGRVTDFVSELEHVDTGRRIWSQETAWLVRDAAGNAVCYEGCIADITERKLNEQKIVHMAMHDALTGLANRRNLMDWLARRAETLPDQPLAVLCIDLDRFKEINDSYGHTAGDLLLWAAADRMSQSAGEEALVARLGGDEFAVILPSAIHAEAAEEKAEALVAALCEDFDIGGRSVAIGASIGICFGAIDPKQTDMLLKNADLALYQVKKNGGGRVRLFDASMDAEAQQRRRIERDLRSAVTGGEFKLVYQPILSLRSGEVSGFEALIRWQHPTHGMIAPSDFIPVAEESELINRIGNWVLNQACADFAAVSAPLSVSVNVSAVQLRQSNFVTSILKCLSDTGLAPQRLTLEITESVLISDNAITRAALKALRGFGIRIALDDFGAGHSSLGYLRQYEFDRIKIDRSFISGGGADKADGAVVNAVIGLGRGLGIEVIAEGIETEEQLDRLRFLGCDSVQGYFIGKPSALSDWPQLKPQSATLSLANLMRKSA